MKRKREAEDIDNDSNNLVADQNNVKVLKTDYETVEDQFKRHQDIIKKHNAATDRFLENFKYHTLSITEKVPVILFKDDIFEIARIDENFTQYLQSIQCHGIEIAEVSLLHHAVNISNIDWVKHLLEEGTNINELTSTKLTIYLNETHKKSYNLPFDTYDSYDTEKFSPLTTAVANNNEEMVKLLVNNGANDNDGNSLVMAVDNNNINIIQYLLDADKNTNIKIIDNNGKDTPLVYACQNGNTYVVKILIEAGADIDFYDHTSCSWPILTAAVNNHLDIVNILLGKGVETKYLNDHDDVNNHLHILEIIKTALYLDRLCYKEVYENRDFTWERAEDNLTSLADKIKTSINKYIELCQKANIQLDNIDLDPYLMLQNRFNSNLVQIMEETLAKKGVKAMQSLLQKIDKNIKEAGLFDSDAKISEIVKNTHNELLLDVMKISFNKNEKDFEESKIMSLKSIAAVNVATDIKQGIINRDKVTELPEEIQILLTTIEKLMPTTVMDINNIGDIHTNDSDIA